MTKFNPEQFLIFFKRFFLFFLFYQVNRFGFYLSNSSLLAPLEWKNILGGIRFDLATLGYINIIFAFLSLIPGAFQLRKGYQRFLFYSFYLVNTFFLCLNFVDYEYFKFIGRRSSYDYITAKGMEQEISGLLKNFTIEFWWIPLFMLFTILISFTLYRRISFKVTKKNVTILNTLFFLLTIGLLVILGRGGVQKSPLRLVDAAIYGNIKNCAVVTNTPYSVIKTFGKSENLEEINFYSPEEVQQVFCPMVEFKYDSINKKNVVLLIVESFGREVLFRGLTPFIDSLTKQSYYFENGFANGKVSIDAIPSTISSIPSLMNTTYISSSYSLNTVNTIPKILNDQGYHTAFFHGAHNGSQNFDRYSNIAEFKEYYGKDQYVGPEAYDGTWGIFDEEFLHFSSEKIDEFPTPFFATLFTISSHNPYTIPDRYKGKFPKGTAKIHESVAYADYALEQFFKQAQTKSWFKDTLFIITADHTSSEPQEEEFKNNVGKFRIPILFYAPFDPTIPIKKESKNFQQIDILPSIIDYLQIDTKVFTFGKSYRSDQDFVVNYLDNIYNYIKGDYYLAFNGEKTLGLYNFKKDPTLSKNLQKELPQKAKQMEDFLKAYIQTFNNRIRDNDLLP
ncbi:LTA synthase family protein [Myroides sp. LJL116]